MAIHEPINALVLQEFRLHAADTADEAARIVAAFDLGAKDAVPLLTSIDDERDVATVRALHAGETTDDGSAQRAALDPLVASWQPVKQYGPRITERSDSPPSYYRLAVTGSGINNAPADPITALSPDAADGAATRLDLLWIGVPLETYAGLMILLGTGRDRDTIRADADDWPLPFTDHLGVRIYESRG
jgi:hypothetical protein